MRRVVVTGVGIISSIGTNRQAVTAALRQGSSGIVYSEEYEELGFRSRVCGSIDIDLTAEIDRKVKRFMGDAAAYNYLAMRDALEDSGLEDRMISNPRTG